MKDAEEEIITEFLDSPSRDTFRRIVFQWYRLDDDGLWVHDKNHAMIDSVILTIMEEKGWDVGRRWHIVDRIRQVLGAQLHYDRLPDPISED